MTKLKLVAFILSNNSYDSIDYTVSKVPQIIDDFFISEDSKDENILEIAKKNNYKLIYNNNLGGYGSNVKNSLCGDIIKTEFVANNSIIKSMRYETESCILCEASASLFSRKIKNKKINILVKEIKKLKKLKKNFKSNFPKNFKEFNQLIRHKNITTIICSISSNFSAIFSVYQF